MYYLQSRYYDPELGRFITSDIAISTGQGLTGNNTFAYCGNNPITRSDDVGAAWETVWDILSLGSSILDVAMNPSDPWAWAGLAGDLIDVAVPFVGGLGEATRAIKNTARATEILDTASDAKKGWKVSEDIVQKATTGSPNSMGKIGEQLAGINPKAKQPIQVNGHTRIPDALTDTTLTEVKNVKYISNTSQLRDFATYAKNTGRTMELYVRPTTKVAQTVIDAGWNIKYLW